MNELRSLLDLWYQFAIDTGPYLNVDWNKHIPMECYYHTRSQLVSILLESCLFIEVHD